MSDGIESRLDEMAAKIAALEEEVASLSKRLRRLRKRTQGDAARKPQDEPAEED